MTLTLRQVAKLIGFGLSLIGSVFQGITFAFNVYAVPLKCIFNFTQSEVELVASANTAGAVLAFVGPLLLVSFGYKVIYTLAFMAVVPGTVLLWLSVVKADFFKDWPSLVVMFQFIVSSGKEIAFFTFMAVGCGNFDKKNAGKVSGIYLAAGESGKAFFAVLYQCFFQETEDLASFFFTIASLNLALLPMCFIFHKPYASEDREEETPLNDSSSGGDTGQTIEEPGTQSASNTTISLRGMFLSLYFHLLFWPSIASYACALAFMNNITTLAIAVHLRQPLHLVYLLTVTISITRFSTGVIYDRFPSTRIGFGLIFFCLGTFITGMIIGVTSGDNLPVYLVTALSGIAMGAGYLVPVLMLSTEFGAQYFGMISGLIYSSQSLLNILIQMILGLMYDHAKFKQHSADLFCHGNICFLWIWVMFLSIATFATVCGVFTLYYTMYLKQRSQ